MKRFLMTLYMIVCVGLLFAQITVSSVQGKVEYEVSAGKWEQVTASTKLNPSSVINTGLNSGLILVIDGKIVSIRAMQKGTVEKLTSATAKSGIKVGAKITESSVSSDSDQQRTNISTASTRASDATKDLEWSE